MLLHMIWMMLLIKPGLLYKIWMMLIHTICRLSPNSWDLRQEGMAGKSKLKDNVSLI
jgi:hypothetical protein